MKVIICVANNMGMMFNHRRLSMDAELRKWLLEAADGRKIFMNKYSYGQFKENPSDNIIVDEDFTSVAGLEDFAFVEDKDILAVIEKIDEILLVKWNRDYPADFFFTVDLKNWKQTDVIEIKGKSHEKITIEKYLQFPEANNGRKE